MLCSAAGSCYVLDDLMNYIAFNPFKRQEMAIYILVKQNNKTENEKATLCLAYAWLLDCVLPSVRILIFSGITA